MIKPTRIRWFSNERLCEVEDVLDQPEAVSAAATLLQQGCPYVLLQDMTLYDIALKDAAERTIRAGAGLEAHLTAAVVDHNVNKLFDRLFKRGKSR